MRQITHAPHGHMLTNVGVWSPDSRWIVYDVRSATDGSVFDGTRIERVDVETGRVEVLYESRNGACCGVVTASPVDDRVVFILGPEHPTPDWQYGPAHRQGMIVRTSQPGVAEPLEARDLIPPGTLGALCGGTHVHVFNGDATLVSFTYDDAITGSPRSVGVAACGRPVTVPKRHPRNHDGSASSVLVAKATETPRRGSDDIGKAFEDAWVGVGGYARADSSHQRYAIAFQGHVATAAGHTISEAFLVDLPDDPADLLGAAFSPRRLTFTASRRHPGIQGPRHWLRSSPDGSRIAMLLRDDAGVVQLFTVSPLGGETEQVTSDPWGVASAFTWSPDGSRIAYVADGSVMTVDVASGTSMRHTEPIRNDAGPRPEACVFSPDGTQIAFMRSVPWNQVFVTNIPSSCRSCDTDSSCRSGP